MPWWTATASPCITSATSRTARQRISRRGIRGSRSFGTKNVGPLQVIVFVGSPLTLYGLPPRGNNHHRERGRKPLSQARFNAKRGEKQGFLPTIDVERDPRFLPQICLLIHGATFFARLLREPQTAKQGRNA